MNWFKKFHYWLTYLFIGTRQRNNLLEEKYSEQIIREDEQRLEEARKKEIRAKVIAYLQGENDEKDTPVIDVIVDEFIGPILPEKDSIIWVDVNEFLRPFRVIRYDYIQNSSEYDSIFVYIVVQPATKSEIVNQYYNIG